jgi:hypothetical protein
MPTRVNPKYYCEGTGHIPIIPVYQDLAGLEGGNVSGLWLLMCCPKSRRFWHDQLA